MRMTFIERKVYEMDYKMWSREYYEKAQQVKEDMEKLKQKLRKTKGDEKRSINSALITLRTMYLDCMKASELLLSRAGGSYYAA